jgi:hypothetical protein
MIERAHDLPLTRQAELLGLSRGSLYYHPRVVPAGDLAIMRRIDELHLDYPFAGSPMLRDLLRGESIEIRRERVASMMRWMGIEAPYRRPHTSKPADGHKIYPYLLRGLGFQLFRVCTWPVGNARARDRRGQASTSGAAPRRLGSQNFTEPRRNSRATIRFGLQYCRLEIRLQTGGSREITQCLKQRGPKCRAVRPRPIP